MTLGGLALAVGILVDDATVEIENINRNLGEGKDVEQAILDGAQQIAVPAFVSTLSICIVFVPMFFLTGVARYLFVPLAEAVVFAMLASYVLSRTLVPTLAMYLLTAHAHGEASSGRASRNPFVRFQRALRARFERFRSGYQRLLDDAASTSRRIFVAGFLALCVGVARCWSRGWDRISSRRSMPASSCCTCARPTGTRIEETARCAIRSRARFARQIPRERTRRRSSTTSACPTSGINLSYSNSAPIGTGDADILVSLKPRASAHRGVRARAARRAAAASSRASTFYFLPADIVSQILNFGLPAPIDVQVVGHEPGGNRAIRRQAAGNASGTFPGIADLRVQQPFDQPKLHFDVDRTKAQQIGLTAARRR